MKNPNSDAAGKKRLHSVNKPRRSAGVKRDENKSSRTKLGGTTKMLEIAFAREIEKTLLVEQELADALPQLARVAKNEKLRKVIRHHARGAKKQSARLIEMMASAIFPAITGKKQTVNVAKDLLKPFLKGKPSRSDLPLIAALQKIKHFEIAVYGTLRSWARLLNQSEMGELAGVSLKEEKRINKRLNRISKDVIDEMSDGA